MIVRCKKHIQCFNNDPSVQPLGRFHTPRLIRMPLPSFLSLCSPSCSATRKRFDGYSSKGAKDWCRRGPYRYRGPVHLRLRGVQPSSEQQTCARLWDPQIFRYKAITNVRYTEHIQCILHHTSLLYFFLFFFDADPLLGKMTARLDPRPIFSPLCPYSVLTSCCYFFGLISTTIPYCVWYWYISLSLSLSKKKDWCRRNGADLHKLLRPALLLHTRWW